LWVLIYSLEVFIEASGSSKARLADFPVRNITVNLSGASNATINASGMLDGNLSGASELAYTGDPTLGTIETSGASRISRG